ncbi:MAG: phospho-2-dehydro-3-deoxyheptonate aldolase [Verrucomicrobiales bacterium]|nr:phospho-2-dehydro-3-deoxyheptonate aldolase [Verrucomicrobiales bacterium]
MSAANEITTNIRVTQFTPLKAPDALCGEIEVAAELSNDVLRHREAIRRTLRGDDQRLLLVVGPCSIHDEEAAYDYANRLKVLSDKISTNFLVVMRVYFEKPRTTVGWKGLINDPFMDGSCEIEEGLRKARAIFRTIAEIGLPCGTEFLDPIVPQYTADLISWAAIGARTTESQTHREMASGLSMPVGFKNATDGGLQIALDAMVSARHPHAFLGIDSSGQTAVVKTTGNSDGHVILRGGGGKTNFSESDIATTKATLKVNGKARSIMVDCSHGNSNKDFRRQSAVFESLMEQYIQGDQAILGMMLESFIVEGRQELPPGNGKKGLVYGQSITDACISWETTEALLTRANEALEARKK